MVSADPMGRSGRCRLGRALLRAAALAAAALFLAAGLAACGSASPGGGVTTTTGSSGEITHPTGPNEVVLRVETGGGFVPVEYNLTMVPEFTLYGDGRVIVTGPVIMIFPGPAMPNLQTTVVSQETVQSIQQAAREAGLFETGFDYGRPGITDVATTTFTVNAGGQTYRSDVYALGMETGAGGLTMEQQQARGALSEFMGKLMGLTAFVDEEPTWESYDFEALAVYSRALDPAASPEPGIEPNLLTWPLADLATAGEDVQPAGYRRVVVSGDELETLKPLLDQATQITVWESGGREYNLFFRPLLPDEIN